MAARVIVGHPLRQAEQQQDLPLAGPVTGLACGGQGGLQEGKVLVPVVPGLQEAGYGGRDHHGVLGPPGGGGVADGRVQVGALVSSQAAPAVESISAARSPVAGRAATRHW